MKRAVRKSMIIEFGILVAFERALAGRVWEETAVAGIVSTLIRMMVAWMRTVYIFIRSIQFRVYNIYLG